MKKLFLLTALIVVAAMSNSFAQDNKVSISSSTSTADAKFDFIEHDFGTIPHAGNGVVEFKFKNIGKEPLLISNATGSCGCTVPEYPKEPIKSGSTGAIKVSYDTKRTGPFTKTVTVTSNSKAPTTILTIKGNVEPAVTEETMPIKKTSEGATPLATPASKGK